MALTAGTRLGPYDPYEVTAWLEELKRLVPTN